MVLKIKNFSLKFGNEPFFQELSFELEKGTLHTLSGKNGCGKSTLLAALRGDLSAELMGTVEIEGTLIRFQIKDALREKIALISQRFDEMIADQFSFLQNLEFAKFSQQAFSFERFSRGPFLPPFH
jgi:ABC-type sugar transport system ATPase subunit